MITVYGYLGHIGEDVRRAAESAALVVGGRRHLDALGVEDDRAVVLGGITPAIERMLALGEGEDAVVVASGDPLFYGVVRRMRRAGLRPRVVTAPTSLQAAFAAVGLPWDDALLVSAHGNDPAPAYAACREHPKVGVLTDHRHGVRELAESLAGLGRTYVLAERLGEDDERVRVLTEDEARTVDPLQPHVVLVLAHHPDSDEATGEQSPVAGRAEDMNTETGGVPSPRGDGTIGQITNSAASRARADAIDEALGMATHRYDGPAADGLPRAWTECDLIISHLALGATTRLIAPLLTSKKADPGVVVVDEGGRFCIPLVGGHGGGANALARRVADGIGATAVLTTATDSLGVTALDTLGWRYAGDVAGVTRAMLDGRPVELVREQAWPLPALPLTVYEPGVPRVERRGVHVTELPQPDAPVARILLTDRIAATEPSAGEPAADDHLPTVVLRPPSLVVGMGCNRGTTADALEALLDRTLAEAGLAKESIAALTSVDAKADEPGLAELATRLGVPFETFTADELATRDVPNPSDAPASAVGTPSVAEASVLARGADLIVEKTKTPEATCAVGRLPALGKLAVVGLGPGSDDLLTPRARHVLETSSMVIGYRPYVAQIRHLLRPGTEVLASGMGAEEERTALAIEEARKGRAVALVCSGDPAIYAMASPTLEQGTDGVEVQVVPGVTAELAVSAILGAPLGHDHATISLSDLHTDWDTIEQRLEAAAQGDFVVTLYNPRSRKRVKHLPRALEILREHRPASTPVAVVMDAERPEQTVHTATLADFDVEWVNMHALVVVGSSTTRFVSTGAGAEAIVTPRDYHWMEQP
ncbi:precorrin-3B C(17)-methyltransferase [Nigerium massiliense]|uniref:precorrin-3B C(17)-methyltransferase n=1 Tax=Nigerium massiliense TaxID=1522317 RepID=UPI0005907CC0|nr:precorrin-3B C(17)-methyltransferase [Nigerium massiliense]